MNNIQLEQAQMSGDIPSPRFGHTFTIINQQKAALFGGAFADKGKFVITNEVFLYNFMSLNWKKIENQGQVPTSRAAHASTCVDLNQLVVYGGAASGGGGLTNDDLYLLDFQANEETPSWMIIPTTGTTPGKRYGHTMVYNKPFLVLFGGNSGTIPINDTWILNIEKAPFIWNKLNFENDVPCVRVYHSAALCTSGSASGMIVVFGGRSNNQAALNDIWGLRRHRNGKWDWVKAPYNKAQIQPLERYQHSTQFFGQYLIITGGRTNCTDQNHLPIEIYDTESSEWQRVSFANRYRHSSILVDGMQLFIYGGFEPDFPNKPLDTMLKIDIAQFFQGMPGVYQKQLNANGNQLNNSIGFKKEKKEQEGSSQEYVKENRDPFLESIQSCHAKQQPKQIRISNTAVVAHTFTSLDEDNPITKVPLDQLQEESKRLGIGFQNTVTTPICPEGLPEYILSKIMDGKRSRKRFEVEKEKIIELCMYVKKVLEKESSVIRLRAPVKIIGKLHGRVGDLAKIFEEFGTPNENTQNGDIEKFDYIFLGNYVDYSFNSLEVVCLLFSLKLQYPDHIFLLRGQHEDIKMNKIYGFADECASRLSEDTNDVNSVFSNINKVFQWLPFAAVVEDKILLVNSGIGKHLNTVDQIETVQRPTQVFQQNQNSQQILVDLMWSEFTANPAEPWTVDYKQKDIFSTGQVTKFGSQRLQKFLSTNNLQLLINSHECSNGFERQCNDQLISVISCTDFLGKSRNSAAILKIKKNLGIMEQVCQWDKNVNYGGWINIDNQKKSNDDEQKIKKIRQYHRN